MSEHPPRPESGPSLPQGPILSPDQTALRNTVPPTPEVPRGQIVEVRQRLFQRGAVNQTTPNTPPVHTNTPIVSAQGPFVRIASGAARTIVQGGRAAGGFLFGFFGYIFVHMIWQGITRAGEMNTGGGGAKPKAGGGGGGHH